MIGRAAARARRGALIVSLLAICSLAGCAPSLALLNLPAGPGEPDYTGATAEASQQAAKHCSSVSSIVALASLNGTLGSQRARGNMNLGVAGSSARLELLAPFGQAFFYFVSHDNAATLLLPRENRVIREADPQALLEALTGIPLGQNHLLPTLVGCPSPFSETNALLDTINFMRFGDDWRMVSSGDGELESYLHRESVNDPWRLVAMVRRRPDGTSWRTEYREFDSDLPRRILMYSPDRFRLELRLSDVELNRPLGPEAFIIKVPATAVPMTLEELRRSGPLAGSSANDQ